MDISRCAQIFICLFFLVPVCEVKSDELKEEFEKIIDGTSKSFNFPVEEWIEGTIDSRVNKELLCDTGFSLAKRIGGDGYFPVLNASVKFTPLGYWFAETVFFYYTEEQEQDEWEPDFVYRFGYEDWRPYTFSLVYSNYTGNRSIHDVAEQYDRGSYSLTWILPVPDIIAQPFLIEPEREISCISGLIYSPRYSTAQEEEDGHDKIRAQISFSVPLYGSLHLSFNLLHYLDSDRQQPWDPDYTYEIAWRGEYFSIAYKNYGGTRFPWRSDLPHDSGFADGSIGITWHWNWLK